MEGFALAPQARATQGGQSVSKTFHRLNACSVSEFHAAHANVLAMQMHRKTI